MVHFAKKFKLQIDVFSSFIFSPSKRRKSVDKMIHRARNVAAECPRSLNPGKAVAMAICPIIVHFKT